MTVKDAAHRIAINNTNGQLGVKSPPNVENWVILKNSSKEKSEKTSAVTGQNGSQTRTRWIRKGTGTQDDNWKHRTNAIKV